MQHGDRAAGMPLAMLCTSFPLGLVPSVRSRASLVPTPSSFAHVPSQPLPLQKLPRWTPAIAAHGGSVRWWLIAFLRPRLPCLHPWISTTYHLPSHVTLVGPRSAPSLPEHQPHAHGGFRPRHQRTAIYRTPRASRASQHPPLPPSIPPIHSIKLKMLSCSSSGRSTATSLGSNSSHPSPLSPSFTHQSNLPTSKTLPVAPAPHLRHHAMLPIIARGHRLPQPMRCSSPSSSATVTYTDGTASVS